MSGESTSTRLVMKPGTGNETKRNGKRNDDPLPNMKIVFKSLLLSPTLASYPVSQTGYEAISNIGYPQHNVNVDVGRIV